ncbi:ATP-binding protein [Ignavibacteria bacterium]|nr:HAMP domain-containing histidine kinase [Bacteroidota bacterium]MCZ2132546.1 HAMP domain-containing histidine kinase [Bacteroidota bacterium]
MKRRRNLLGTSHPSNRKAGKLHYTALWLRSPSKWKIKALLAFFAFSMVASVLLYTQSLVNELVRREIIAVEFYASIFEHNFASADNNPDLLFLLDRVAPTITFPMIFADVSGEPNWPYLDFSKNIDVDTTQTKDQQREYMLHRVAEMAAVYHPIDIKDESGAIITRIYYTNSSLIGRIRLLPYVEIVIVSAFILLSYVAFSYVRRSEESNVWVGMAKEAAHQLGTPLSSLLAWVEILRLNVNNPEQIEETTTEIEQDIARLNIIATRFSKIGSEPEMKSENLGDVIENVCIYFEKRVPHLGKQIIVERNLDFTIDARINGELFGWVVENLLKNAVEAIDSSNGRITITLGIVKGKLTVTVSDNGKGMSVQTRRQIFLPGYTTKKRGWGLGLSLSKRIIEAYHRGKIAVRDSAPGKGTTFIIELPEYSVR